MNIKRALWTGVVLWVLIFFEVSILMFGFGYGGTETSYLIIHYIALAILIAISSLLYFSGKKIKKGLNEGLILGLIFVIVGIILDAIITVPLFVKDYVGFFFNWNLVAGFILTLIVTGIVGLIKK
jgi:hypothetical protein